MIVTRDYTVFAKRNLGDCRALLIWHTGVRDKRWLEDTLQNFFIRLKKFQTLEKWDPLKEAKFETYIDQALLWSLKRRGIKELTEHVSYENWHNPSCVEQRYAVNLRVQSFVRWIKKEVPVESRDRMLKLLRIKAAGVPLQDTPDRQLYREYLLRFLSWERCG